MATSAKKSAPKRTAAADKTAAKSTEPAKKTPVKKAPVKKATAKKTPAKQAPTKRVAMKTNENRTPATAPAKSPKKVENLTVREGETPWTAAELAELRSELEADVVHLNKEIHDAEQEIVGLLRDGGDGAGNDQADVGSTTLERDHEMSLANNARDMLEQIERALARIDDGTYGICESCGNAVGKGRLQAFPRATLCVSCKEREERR
ncbi:TraR/DksA family transcriptional regulator [Kribbella sp. VKM Ac-2527]|uniref:TraR/DksA family transcriptional regulator n=1 Tax=Kribbella caucasensis TaxID=2512215 RepID=A0A4R6KHY4_9ACTN|nr:TraR/DksA family transcriptional regulator [Kribbella sp. VKM Ac-2527]